MEQPEPSDRPRRRRGYASGAFDLFHVGHLRYLQAAARACDHLTVGVPDDCIIAQVKGRPPLTPQAERLEMIAGLACVGTALPVSIGMDNPDRFIPFILQLGIDVMLIGGDWEDTPRWRILRPLLTEAGVEVAFLPRAGGISSTALRARIVAQIVAS